MIKFIKEKKIKREIVLNHQNIVKFKAIFYDFMLIDLTLDVKISNIHYL